MRKDYLDQIADRKEKMRAILNTAETEKRTALTADEKREFEMYEQECDILERKFRAENPFEKGFGYAPDSVCQRFAEQVTDAVQGGRVETMSLRAINAEAAVHDASVPVIFQDLQKPLEKGLVLSRLGAKIMYGVQGEPMWPFVDGQEATVLGENDEVGDTQLTFETLKSTPKRIAMSFAVSNRAINQSNLNLYSLVMEGLGMGVARKLNHIMFDKAKHGDFSGMFVGLTAPNIITRTTANTFKLEDLIALEHAVLDQMVDAMNGNSAYVMNTKTAAILKSTFEGTGQLKKLLDMHYDPATNRRWGTVNGYRAEFSNYVPDNVIQFGDFNYCAIPQFGDMKIIVDPYSLKKKNAVEITLNTEMDMVRIRKEAFAVSNPKVG